MADDHERVEEASLATRSRLVEDLRRLGVGDRPGSVVIVHTSMSAIGWVVGGAQTVAEALLDAVGAEGTILVLTGWQDGPPYHQQQWDEERRRSYMQECPPFDPRKAHADGENGRVPEAVRTWPGAAHSRHPACAFAAVGARAEWLVEAQSLDEGYGDGSPLHRLVEAGGDVLVLGAPLETVTLLHYAEYLARAPEKRWVEYEMPILVGGQRVWRRIRELDSTVGAFPYEELDFEEDAFAVMAKDALRAGIGRAGTVGSAESYLFPAAPLAEHARTWLETRFQARA